MTDDLVKRLRDPRMTVHGRAGMTVEAADRIEQLQADQQQLDAILDYLGIADSDIDPVSYIRKMVAEMEHLRKRISHD